MRNPRRTASTSAALMIGLALVSFIAIIGASFKGTFADAIDNQIRADFVLSPKNFQGFSPEAAAAVRKQLPGSTVVQFRGGQVLVNGASEDVTGASPNFETCRRPQAPLRLRPPGVRRRRRHRLQGRRGRRKEGAARARRLKFTFPKGDKEVTVAGIFTDKKALPGNGDYVLSLADWNLFNEPLDQFVLVLKPAGVPTSEADRTIKGSPTRSAGSAPTTRPSSRTASSRSSTRS